MIIKKYQAATEKEAITLAKEELGNDAIVMNIKTISPKGFYKLFRRPKVEVTAAVDDNITYGREKHLSNTNKKERLSGVIYDDHLSDDKDTVDKLQANNLALEEKLNNLQSLLENQVSKSDEKSKSNEGKQQESGEMLACIQLIYKQLISNEVDEKYANLIMNEIEGSMKKESSMNNILASVYQKLVLKLGQTKTITYDKKTPKFIFFIGPTGVGKTTTIAKVASKFKIDDKAKIAFLTSDTYRIAAVEQLRIYANILGIPLNVIYSEEEMIKAREEFADYDLVFVDTAGRSHRNKEHRDDIESLINCIPKSEREIYLVLSITTKYIDLVKITEAYSNITGYNLLFTKFDETSTIGNLLNIRMLTGAPLSYITNGQEVPDDISVVNPQNIAKQLLR